MGVLPTSGGERRVQQQGHHDRAHEDDHRYDLPGVRVEDRDQDSLKHGSREQHDVRPRSCRDVKVNQQVCHRQKHHREG